MQRSAPNLEELVPLFFENEDIHKLLMELIRVYRDKLEGSFEDCWQQLLAIIILFVLANSKDKYKVLPVGRSFAVPKSLPITGTGEDMFNLDSSITRFNSYIVRREPDGLMFLLSFGSGEYLAVQHSSENFRKQVKSATAFFDDQTSQAVREVLSQAASVVDDKQTPIAKYILQHAPQLASLLSEAQQKNKFQAMFDVLSEGHVDASGRRQKDFVLLYANPDERKALQFLPLINEVHNNLRLAFQSSVSFDGDKLSLRPSGAALSISPVVFSQRHVDFIPSHVKFKFEQEIPPSAITIDATEVSLVKMADPLTPYVITDQTWESAVEKSRGWATKVRRRSDPKSTLSIKFISMFDAEKGIPKKFISTANMLPFHIHAGLLTYTDQVFFTKLSGAIYASFVTEKIEGSLSELISLVHSFAYSEALYDPGKALMHALWYPFMSDLFNGLFYLHDECDYVHGSLSAHHVVYTINGTTVNFKISDSFINQEVPKNADHSITRVGTEGYRSPEAEWPDKYPVPLSKRSDVFSLGMVILAFLAHLQVDQPYLKDKDSGARVTLLSLASKIIRDTLSGKRQYPGELDFVRVYRYLINNYFCQLMKSDFKNKATYDFLQKIDFSNEVFCNFLLKLVRFEPGERTQQIDKTFLQNFSQFRPKTIQCVDAAKLIVDAKALKK